MYAPNYRSAQTLQTRIESSILNGTLKQLKQELNGGKRTIWTVHSFYERFLKEYCKPRMRSWRSYESSFKSLNVMLGNIPLKVFQHKDLRRYVGPGDAVLLSRQRRSYTRFGVYRLIERSAARVPSLAGRRVTPHAIRHTSACHLLQAGIDLNTIRA